MKNGYLAPLLLLVSLALIDPSEEHCVELFKFDYWSNYVRPDRPITLVQPKDPKDIMECSLERMCIEEKNNMCYILRDCFNRPIGSEVTEKCKGESFGAIQFYHFMCWTAKAVHEDVFANASCDDYDQTTLPPTTNATLPDSTAKTTTTATLPQTTTTLPESTTITTTSTTTTTTATLPLTTNSLGTATTKVTPNPTGNNSGLVSNSKSSSDASTHETETLTLKILLLMSVVFNVAGPLLVFLYIRHRQGPMIQQNGTNGAVFQSELELKPLSDP